MSKFWLKLSMHWFRRRLLKVPNAYSLFCLKEWVPRQVIKFIISQILNFTNAKHVYQIWFRFVQYYLKSLIQNAQLLKRMINARSWTESVLWERLWWPKIFLPYCNNLRWIPMKDMFGQTLPTFFVSVILMRIQQVCQTFNVL